MKHLIKQEFCLLISLGMGDSTVFTCFFFQISTLVFTDQDTCLKSLKFEQSDD